MKDLIIKGEKSTSHDDLIHIGFFSHFYYNVYNTLTFHKAKNTYIHVYVYKLIWVVQCPSFVPLVSQIDFLNWIFLGQI